MLPEMDGIAVTENIRVQRPLLLSAKNTSGTSLEGCAKAQMITY